MSFGAFSAVWNRRALPPSTPRGLNAEDDVVARQQAKIVLDYARHLRFEDQTWVNERSAQLRADSKLLQLSIARKSAMRTPATLVSNDLAEIRSFISRYGAVICKPVAPMRWQDGDDILYVSTTQISLADIEEELSVQACAMIYQENIIKQYELRVVCWGGEIVTCRLQSQAQTESSQDWRLVDPALLMVEQIETPTEIESFIKEVQAETGIVHGSFDFAVDHSGNYIFFEVNEQGQTLWLEESNPNIRILDRTVEFLTCPTQDYRWSGSRVHSLDEFLSSPVWTRARAELEIEHPYNLAVP